MAPSAQKIYQCNLVWLLTLRSFSGHIVVGLLNWNSLDWSTALLPWIDDNAGWQHSGLSRRLAIEQENNIR